MQDRELELAAIALRKDALLAKFANVTALWRNLQTGAFAAVAVGVVGVVQHVLSVEALSMVLGVSVGSIGLSLVRLRVAAIRLDVEVIRLVHLIERLKSTGGR